MFGIDLVSLIIRIPAVLLCIGLHEAAHGYAAYKLGDPTARNLGRLSLNPLAHIDPIGFLCLLLFKFGWAKPVPINTRYFKKPKRDIALTALAGPVSNFILAAAALLLQKLLITVPSQFTFALATFCNLTAIMSIGLGVFNLIPIPPLDGSKIFYPILPTKWIYQMQSYEMYIQFGLLLLLWSGLLSIPLGFLTSIVYTLLVSLIFW